MNFQKMLDKARNGDYTEINKAKEKGQVKGVTDLLDKKREQNYRAAVAAAASAEAEDERAVEVEVPDDLVVEDDEYRAPPAPETIQQEYAQEGHYPDASPHRESKPYGTLAELHQTILDKEKETGKKVVLPASY